MAAPYTSVSISGYNSNPPADDGTQTEANRVKWSTIKEKLPDPLKTGIEAVNSNLVLAFAKVLGGGAVTTTAISLAVASTDQGKLIRATAASITITTPDATDVDDPFVFAVRNDSSGSITLDGNGSQTIDGVASLTLSPTEGLIIFTDGANWFTTGRSGISVFNTGFALLNGTLSAAVASNALTIAIKGNDGNDPSAGNPVYVVVRSATASNGAFTLMALTAATSLVISSGSSLGAGNSSAFRIWIVGFNDGGTFRLGAINCRNGIGTYPLAPWSIASSTAEGGAGGADTAFTFYTGTAVSAKAYQILGYMTWESGLATGGTWNVGPTRIQLYGLGVPLPGQVVQSAGNQTGAVATTTTTFPIDDTVPQNTEGAEFMSQAITPSSSANLLEVDHVGFYSLNPSATIGVGLFQDSTAAALAAVASSIDANTGVSAVPLIWQLLAATTSSTTFKIRAGSGAGATLTFNGANSARLFGGAAASKLLIREIMA